MILNTNNNHIEKSLLQLLHLRKGHFLTESGKHTDGWFDLDQLFHNLGLLQPIVSELGKKLITHKFDIICGPMDGGARIAKMISNEFNVEYIYSERHVLSNKNSTKQLVSYSIPKIMQNRINGKRFALVDDVINAGAATKSTFYELTRFGGTPVVLGCLVIKSNIIYDFTKEHNLQIENITKVENNMWSPKECPLCLSHLPIESVV